MNTTNPIYTYYLFARAHKENYFSWTWATLIGCLIAGKGFPSPKPTILSFFVVLAITSCVYIYNDVQDLEMDKLNPKKRERPLPSGRSTKKDAMLLVYVCGFLGVILSIFLNLTSSILSLIFLFLFLIYSHPLVRLKKIFIVKEIVVASGYILTTLIGGYAVAGKFLTTFIFAGLLYFFFSLMGMPAFHDITDVKEDELYGVKTLAIVLSWTRKVQLFMLFILIIMTLTPLTYVSLGFNIVLPIVVVAMGIVVLRYLIPLSTAFEEALFIKTRRISYVYYILIHITLVIATINV